MRTLPWGLLLLPVSAVAQVMGQYESTDDRGERTLFRSVLALASDGTNILIEQVLKPLPDGSLEYRPTSQPASTRDYDARICGPEADPPTTDSISIWSADVVHGVACHRTYDLSESVEADAPR